MYWSISQPLYPYSSHANPPNNTTSKQPDKQIAKQTLASVFIQTSQSATSSHPSNFPILHKLPKFWIRGLDLNPPNNLRWIPRNHTKVLHTLRHHTARTHRNPSPDSHPRQHNSITTKPAILTNRDG